jgi:hypothetical protein
MRIVMIVALLAFATGVCRADSSASQHCTGSSVNAAAHQRSVKACPVIQLAQANRCSCITYAGTKCTGPCIHAGKPYGCLCK